MNPALIAGLVSAGGSLLGSAVSAGSSAKQMRFQERMSSTAHQREVTDLRKAGLNPILSAGGKGASSPSGASFQGDTKIGSSAVAAKIAASQMTQQLKNMKTTNELTKLQQLTEVQRARDLHMSANNRIMNEPQIESQTEINRATRSNLGQMFVKLKAEAVSAKARAIIDTYEQQVYEFLGPTGRAAKMFLKPR